jgi:restriction system protein
VARPSKRQARAAQRAQEKAVQLMALGGGMVLVPLVLSSSPFGKALSNLFPLGLLFLVAGGALLWWHRSQAGASPASTSLPRIDPTQPARHKSVAREPARPPEPIRPAPEPAITPKGPAPAATAEPARPTRWSKAVLDVIEWRRFEAVVEALFQQAGFETRSQSHGADGGVDIWLYSRHQPGIAVSLVQCKHWQGKQVGVDKIRELRGVMAAHHVPRGQFATTSTFSDDARAFARENGVHLLDANRLLELIGGRTADQQQALLDVALEGEYWRPTCVNCGVKMVERTSSKDGVSFWGCVNYPRCKKTMTGRQRFAGG